MNFRFPAALAMFAAAAATQTFVPPAAAHSWYDYACCHDRDCRPVDFDAVRVTPEGYRIEATGVVIPFSDSRIRATPANDRFQRYHLCTDKGRAGGRVLCLYVPRGGV